MKIQSSSKRFVLGCALLLVLCGQLLIAATNGVVEERVTEPVFRAEIARAVFFECLWSSSVRAKIGDSVFDGSAEEKLVYKLFKLAPPFENLFRAVCISAPHEDLIKPLSFLSIIDESSGERAWLPYPAAPMQRVLAPAAEVGEMEITFKSIRAAKLTRDQSKAYLELVQHWLLVAKKRSPEISGDFAVFRGAPSDRRNYVLSFRARELIEIPGVALTKGTSDEVLAGAYRLAQRWSFAEGDMTATKGSLCDLQAAVANCVVFGDTFTVE